MNRVTRPLLTALLAISIGLVMRVAFVGQNDFDSTDLTRYEGQPYGVDLPDWYGDYPFLLAWTRGDGQAFVTIAADPLGRDESLGLSRPSYRLSRLGYSLISRALVGWQQDLIPIGLFLTNLFAMAGLGVLAGWKTVDWGPRALLLLVSPAVLIGVTADTAEVLGFLLLVLAVTSTRSWLVVSAAALLGITRPSYATGLPLASRWLSATGAALVAVITLQVGLWLVSGLSWGGAAGNLTWPLVGYVEAWPNMQPTSQFAAIAVLVGALATVARGSRARPLRTRLAWMTSGLLAISLGPLVVTEPVNLLRAVGVLPLLWIVPWEQPHPRTG